MQWAFLFVPVVRVMVESWARGGLRFNGWRAGS